MRTFAVLLAGAAFLLGLGPTGALAEGDAANGERWANRVCKACHTFQAGGPQRLGPNLWGIVGAVPGQVEGFDRYKVAPLYVENGIEVWTEDHLRDYFTNPATFRDTYADGESSAMIMAPLKPEIAQDIVTYLGTLAD
jgi:cytochrome c